MKAVTYVNGIPRMRDVTATVVTYSANMSISSPVTANTSVTLPASETYSDVELSIFLRGVRLDTTNGYYYVGDIPRTQVAFTFDLVVGDLLVFRKEHN